MMSRSVAQFIADNLAGVTVEQAQAWLEEYGLSNVARENVLVTITRPNRTVLMNFDGHKVLLGDGLRAEIKETFSRLELAPAEILKANEQGDKE